MTSTGNLRRQPRITVRALEVDRDLEAWTAIFSQRPVARGTLQVPFVTTRYWQPRIESDFSERSLVAEIEGHVVGCIGFHLDRNRRRHVGSLGMGVDFEFQGQGVGSALMAVVIDLADNWYNLRRMELEVYTDNEAGIALYRKFGFEEEGVYRNYAYRDGEYVDALAMARLREDPWATHPTKEGLE
ncbi:GNAT family N-acetyltransferase [soil metagenome]